MNARVSLLIGALLLLGLSSCKKDKDEHGPVIEILLPGSGHSITVPDSITVKVKVIDDRNIETVSFSLQDNDGVPIAASITVAVGTKEITLQRTLVVNSASITSGNYSVAIRASDGEQTTSAFRQVSVQEEPLRLRALFMVPNGSGSIMKVDSAGNISSFLTLSNIGEVAVNSQGQHLYVAGDEFAPLQVHPTNTGSNGWQLANQNGGSLPYFLDVRTDPKDQRTYISSNDGLIRGFYKNSTPQFNAHALPEYRPYACTVIGDQVVSEQRAIAQNEKRLVIYTYANGALMNSFPLDADVVQLSEHSAQQALLFGNRDGEGVIQLRNIMQGGNYELRTFSEGPITATCRISQHVYIIALPTSVVRYSYSDNSVITLMNTTAADLAFDKVNGSVHVAASGQWIVLDPITGTIVNSTNLPMEIGRILPLYNR